MRRQVPWDLLLGAGVLAALLFGGKKVYDMTRGIRNNNPGNVKLVPGVVWVGQVPPEQQTDPVFVQTSKPEYGIRMMARILTNYGSKAGLPGVGGPGIDTVREIITRWSETDREPYIAYISKALGVRPDQPIGIVQSLPRLIPGIVQFENGQQPYDVATIARGIALA